MKYRELTVTQYADELKLTRQGAYYRIKKGLVKTKKIGGTVIVLLPEREYDSQRSRNIDNS